MSLKNENTKTTLRDFVIKSIKRHLSVSDEEIKNFEESYLTSRKFFSLEKNGEKGSQNNTVNNNLSEIIAVLLKDLPAKKAKKENGKLTTFIGGAIEPNHNVLKDRVFAGSSVISRIKGESKELVRFKELFNWGMLDDDISGLTEQNKDDLKETSMLILNGALEDESLKNKLYNERINYEKNRLVKFEKERLDLEIFYLGLFDELANWAPLQYVGREGYVIGAVSNIINNVSLEVTDEYKRKDAVNKKNFNDLSKEVNEKLEYLHAVSARYFVEEMSQKLLDKSLSFESENTIFEKDLI